jgi:hypothetical protein
MKTEYAEQDENRIYRTGLKQNIQYKMKTEYTEQDENRIYRTEYSELTLSLKSKDLRFQ